MNVPESHTVCYGKYRKLRALGWRSLQASPRALLLIHWLSTVIWLMQKFTATAQNPKLTIFQYYAFHMCTFCRKRTHSKKIQTQSPRDTLTIDALLFSASSLIHWWYAPLTTTLSNIFTVEWLYGFRRVECVYINLFVSQRFHSVCCLTYPSPFMS